MRTIILNVTTALAVLFFAFGAYADDQVTGAGGSYWARSQTVTSTQACFSDGTSRCMLFAAGTSRFHKQRVAVVKTSAAVQCCWASGGSFDVDGLSIVGTGEYGSGFCAGFELAAAGDEAHQQPSRSAMRTAATPGTRTGLCSTAYTIGGDALYAPCSTDAECTEYGGGTCTASPTGTQAQSAGVMLICNTLSGTARVTARKEIVNP